LLVCLFPIQWVVGIMHIVTGHNSFLQDNSNGGHLIPGYGFVVVGIFYIWNGNDKDKIMYYEIVGLLIFAPLELIGEMLTHDLRNVGSSGSHHMTVDTLLIVTSILFLIYRRVKFENWVQWHEYTACIVLIMYGYILQHHHDHGGGTGEPLHGIHAIGGWMIMALAFTRLFCNMILSGILCIMHGILFIFSNQLVTYVWIFSWKFNETAYLVGVLAIGLYVAAINGILNGVYYKYNKINNGVKEIKYLNDVEKSGLEDTLSNGNKYEIETLLNNHNAGDNQ